MIQRGLVAVCLAAASVIGDSAPPVQKLLDQIRKLLPRLEQADEARATKVKEWLSKGGITAEAAALALDRVRTVVATAEDCR